MVTLSQAAPSTVNPCSYHMQFSVLACITFISRHTLQESPHIGGCSKLQLRSFTFSKLNQLVTDFIIFHLFTIIENHKLDFAAMHLLAFDKNPCIWWGLENKRTEFKGPTINFYASCYYELLLPSQYNKN